jgi:fibronectin-binding autotransporter adhesin
MRTPYSRLLHTSLAAGLLAVTTISYAVDGTWTNSFGGSWPDPANWLGGNVATGADGIADFSTLDLLFEPTVSLDGARTIGRLRFGDTTPDANWLLSVGTGGPLTVAVTTGAPVVHVANQSATLDVVVAGTAGLTKTGPGALVLGHTNTLIGPVTVQSGKLQLNGILGLPAGAPITLGDAATGLADTILEMAQATTAGDQNVLAAPITVSSTAPASKAIFRWSGNGSTAGAQNGTITLQDRDLYLEQASPLRLFNMAGVISGTGDIHIASSDPINVPTARFRINNNANSFVGNVYVDSGLLQIQAGGGTATALPFGTDVIISTIGRFDLGASEAINRLSGAGIVRVNTGASVAQTLTVGEANGSATFAGTMQDQSATQRLNLIKAGAGTQELSGTSTASGTIVVNGGTLHISGQIYSGASLAAGAAILTVNGGGTLQIESLGDGFNGPLGSLPLNYQALVLNGGRVRVTGTEPFAQRGFNIGANGATLEIPVGGSFTKTASGNGINSAGGSLMLDGEGTGQLEDALGTQGTWAGASLIKNGAGTWTLTGANTYPGPTRVNDGTLALGQFASLASASVTVGENGTLDVSGLFGPFTLAAGQSLGGSGAVKGSVVASFDAILAPGTSAGTLTFSNDLALAGATLRFELASTTTIGGGVNDLIQLHGGTLDLSGGVTTVEVSGTPIPGTYTLIRGAGMIVGGAANLQATGVRGTYSFDTTSVPGSVLLIANPTGAAPLVWTGASGTAWDNLTTPNWLNGGTPDVFVVGDIVSFNDSALTHTVSLVGSLQPSAVTVSASSNYVFQGAGKISGATGVTKSGPGTLTLGGTNDFTGPLTINGGTVKAGVNPQLPVGARVVVNPGGAYDFNSLGNVNTRNYSFTIAGAGPDGSGAVVNTGGTGVAGNVSVSNLVLAADASVGGTARWDIGTSASNMWANGGGFTLTKVGANEINVRTEVVSNFAGIVISGGTLKHENYSRTTDATATITNYVGSGTVLASFGALTLNYPVVFRGGNLDSQSGTAIWTGPMVLQSNATFMAVNNNPMLLGGPLSGPGNLSKASAGILTLTNAASHTGGTFINAGTLTLGASGSLAGTPRIILASGTTFNPSAAGDYAIPAGQTIAGGGASAGNLIGNFILQPGASLVPGGDGAFGTLAVTTNLTLTGGTLAFDLNRSLTVGGGVNDLLQIGTNLFIEGSVTIVISGNPTNGTYTIITNIAGTRGGGGGFTLVNQTRAALTLDVSHNNRVTVTAVQGTPVNLVWQGDGVDNLWNVGGVANWRDGVTPSTFFQGDVAIFNDAGSQSPAVNLTQGLQPSAVIVTNATGSYIFGGAGALQGAATLTKGGAGTLILTNNQAHTGPNLITGGTLQVGVAGTAGTLGTGPITNQSTVTYFRSDAAAVAIGNVLAGAGTLNFLGTGAAIQSQYSLTAVNSGFTGIINLELARLQNATDATRFGNPGMINVPAGSGLFLSTASTFNQPVSIAGQGWLENAAPGRLGAIRFTGSTWSGPITLTADARLATHGSSATVSGPLSGAFELEIAGTSGASTFNLNSSVNGTASTRLSNFGTSLIATMNHVNALSSGPLWLNAGSTLRLNSASPAFASLNGTNGTVANNHASTAATLTVGMGNPSTAFDGTLVNGAAAALNLTKTGNGTLTLSGNSTYSGATTINAGRLALTGLAALTNSATFNLSSGAVLDVSGLAGGFVLGQARTQTLAGTGAVVGNFSDAFNSALILPGGSAVIGTLSFSNTLALAGGSWTFDLTGVTTPGGAFNDLVNVRGDLVLADGTFTVFNVSLGSTPVPGTYRLLTWQGTRSGFGTVQAGALPGIVANLIVNDANRSIDLVVEDVPSLKWSGATDNEWEPFGAKVNWLDGATPTTWSYSKKARFDDAGNNTSISVVADPLPAGITVSNVTKEYSFNGFGGITGGGNLVKQGAGRLTIANSFNSWSGGTAIQGGTLQVGDGSNDGSLPPLVQNNAALIFHTVGFLTHAGGISGTGTLAKVGSGILTVSGDNSAYTGPVTVAQGELSVQDTLGLGGGQVSLGGAATTPADVPKVTLRSWRQHRQRHPGHRQRE